MLHTFVGLGRVLGGKSLGKYCLGFNWDLGKGAER